MPDRIPGKGEAMARMASFSLKLLVDAGIPTHFLRFEAPDCIEVRLLRIMDPEEQPLAPTDYVRLIPLQVIYRNRLPQGSSVFRRLAANSLALEDIGLRDMPVPGHSLLRPAIEFTTKLEEIDRHVSPREAQSIAGLDDAQFARVRELTLDVNRVLCRHAEAAGLELADGKVEFGLDELGNVILVDTAGTLDENRFLRNGVHVSKQLIRNYYLPSGLEERIQSWVAAGRARSSWPTPPPLPPALVELASDLYRSMAERWTGERWGAPDLEDVVARIRERSLAGDAS